MMVGVLEQFLLDELRVLCHVPFADDPPDMDFGICVFLGKIPVYGIGLGTPPVIVNHAAFGLQLA